MVENTRKGTYGHANWNDGRKLIEEKRMEFYQLKQEYEAKINTFYTDEENDEFHDLMMKKISTCYQPYQRQ